MTSTHPGTALVTGASSGIGAIYARRLAERGYSLILVARNVARLESLAAKIRTQTGRQAEVLPADLSTREGTSAVAARLASDATITMLVNNAGISMKGGLLDSDPAEIEELIAINITAPALLAAAAGRAFAQRKAGTIINIASVLALATELFEGVYSGSKAFLLNLTQKLALDLKDSGVHVQAVLPGATRTEIWERSGKDADALMPGLVMDVHDLVDAALTGLDRGELITIPPLADEAQWTAYTNARIAMLPNLSRRDVAPRYRETIAA